MYVSFKLDQSRFFAIDGKKVNQIINCEGIFPLPRQKAEVLGVVCVKGMLIPVFDFRRLMPELFPEWTPLPHLILFYGNESLNAFPAEALEGITEECVMAENNFAIRFLERYDLIYNDGSYSQLNFTAIEQHLNIP